VKRVSCDPFLIGMSDEIRCQSCGRFFTNRADLSQHEISCRTAKEATEYGRRQLRGEFEDPNEPEEGESRTHQPRDPSETLEREGEPTKQ
jgi:hypothetical protein